MENRATRVGAIIIVSSIGAIAACKAGEPKFADCIVLPPNGGCRIDQEIDSGDAEIDLPNIAHVSIPAGAVTTPTVVTVAFEPARAEASGEIADLTAATNVHDVEAVQLRIATGTQPKAAIQVEWTWPRNFVLGGGLGPVLLDSAAEGGANEMYQVLRIHGADAVGDQMLATLEPATFVSLDGAQQALLMLGKAYSNQADMPSSPTCPLPAIAPPLAQMTVATAYGPRVLASTGATADHQGLDFTAAEGTEVLAAAAGTVIEARATPQVAGPSATGLGYLITIEHTNGTRTRYAHLAQGSYQVTVGQSVAAGAVIAHVGQSGGATAPHLHFEYMTHKGATINPAPCITP